MGGFTCGTHFPETYSGGQSHKAWNQWVNVPLGGTHFQHVVLVGLAEVLEEWSNAVVADYEVILRFQGLRP